MVFCSFITRVTFKAPQSESCVTGWSSTVLAGGQAAICTEPLTQWGLGTDYRDVLICSLGHFLVKQGCVLLFLVEIPIHKRKKIGF